MVWLILDHSYLRGEFPLLYTADIRMQPGNSAFPCNDLNAAGQAGVRRLQRNETFRINAPSA